LARQIVQREQSEYRSAVVPARLDVVWGKQGMMDFLDRQLKAPNANRL
jgi:hypothetical protein